MKLTDEEIRQGLQLREESSLEFKQAEFLGNRLVSLTRSDWADGMTAFANGTGGVIFCEIGNAGEVLGLNADQLVELDGPTSEICAGRLAHRLEFKDRFCRAVRHCLTDCGTVGRWIRYRDDLNDTGLDSAETLTEATLELPSPFVEDAKAFAAMVDWANDG